MICNAFAVKSITPSDEARIGRMMRKFVASEARKAGRVQHRQPQITSPAMVRARDHILQSLAVGPLTAREMLEGSGVQMSSLRIVLGIMGSGGLIRGSEQSGASDPKIWRLV